MTAPTLQRMKFWIVVPKYAENQIKNPTFASPDYAEDWTVKGASAVIAETGDEARWGVYSMQVTPVTGVNSVVYYAGLSVESGLAYTFSCYVKGIATQTMRIMITDSTGTAKATTTFTATGYWQRVEVSWTSNATATNYQVQVIRNSVASTAAFYVDGAQFEQNSVATTFFDGYTPGCHWTGTIRNSTSARTDNTGLGGELLCINDYASITKHIGFGMGQWDQIMTKMTVGGDMYQTHTRKSRTVALNLAYTGESHGELQAKRKIILDALRPDLLSNLPVREQFGINMPGSWRGHEQRILRYQGFDANGNEATNPVDIICAFESCHSDTPDTETSQRDTLIFTVPSGLFQGAYHEGAVLDYHANFPAEYIVRRDSTGNWCRWNISAYESLIDGLTGYVHDMAEGPDGKIYACGTFTDAGGVAGADYLARWDPITETWETVYAGILQTVRTLAFDANGDLYIGGNFQNLGDGNGDFIAKITGLRPDETPAVSSLGTGLNAACYDIVISPSGVLYACGLFTLAGGVSGTAHIAKWDGSAWSALDTGLNGTAFSMAFSNSEILWIGGNFTAADGVNGDYLCFWDGSAFQPYWQPQADSGTEINNIVRTLAFDHSGKLYAGGDFTNAGGSGGSYIARYNGSNWESLGSGLNGVVHKIYVALREIYVSGDFTTAGGITFADRIAVWDNGAWLPLDIDLPGSATLTSILIANDSSLYVGGYFSTAGEDPDENAKCGIISDRMQTVGVASASANTYPVISFVGPGTLKMVKNYRTGKFIAFDGLVLQAGEWVSLNLDPLNLSFRSGWAGRGDLMRYIVAGSDYGDFYISPGVNYISVFMDGNIDSNTKASILWVPKFWSIEGALL